MAALLSFCGKQVKFSFVQTWDGTPQNVVNTIELAEKFLDDPNSYSIDELAVATLTVAKLAYFQRKLKINGGCRLATPARKNLQGCQWSYEFKRPNYRLFIYAYEVIHEGHRWTPLLFYQGAFPDFAQNLEKILRAQLTPETLIKARLPSIC